MRWFCTGHFAATWLVCTSLLFRFHSAGENSVMFIVFAVILWPLLLALLPIKGYFFLKRITLDRLKDRVQSGELKKAVVFTFGFCTSLLAAITISVATWAVGAADGWFKDQDGVWSLAHTLAWFPVAFLAWVLPPTLAIWLLARGKATA